MFVVIVTFQIIPDHLDEFIDAVKQQAENSLNLETDCHYFDVCQSSNDPNKIILYEHYSDKVAFDDHLKSTHFEKFDALVSPWIVEKNVSTGFRL